MPETQGPPVHDDKSIEQLAGELMTILADRARRRDLDAGDQPKWISTLQLARKLGIREGGSADSRKRGVRVVIKHVDQTRPGEVVRSFRGIALAQTPADREADRQMRRKAGVTQLAAAARADRSVAQDDIDGQLRIQGHDHTTKAIDSPDSN